MSKNGTFGEGAYTIQSNEAQIFGDFSPFDLVHYCYFYKLYIIIKFQSVCWLGIDDFLREENFQACFVCACHAIYAIVSKF